MRLGFILIGVSALALSAPVLSQEANVEGRVVKLEKEMRAVQRKVFPEGAGKVFEPEIKSQTPGSTNTGSTTSSAVSDLISRVDSLETQLATLTGTVERQGNTMRSMDARLKSVENELQSQTAAGTGTTAPLAASPKPVVTPVSTSTPKPATLPPTKPSASRTAAVTAIGRPSTGNVFEDGYNYGYRLWEAKFYPEAQTTLQETVTKFPKHARGSYARNLLGRAWLDDKKPATAVKIFYDNYKNDPRGDRAPESLYFLGQSLIELGKNAEACEAFGQLQTAYPDAATGRLADRLASGRTRAKCK
jgi:TolA-binding protein